MLAEALLLLAGYTLCIVATHMLGWLDGARPAQSKQEREDAARHRRHMQAHERRATMRVIPCTRQDGFFVSSDKADMAAGD